MIDKKTQGKRNRVSGSRFELKVRKNLESKGWIVLKNPNNVVNKQFIQGKSKYNPFTKRLMMNSGGFPDFICFRMIIVTNVNSPEVPNKLYEVIGVEVKSNGYLDKIEKQKCQWLLDNNVFSKILIASKSKIRGEIIYKEFKN
ncbi:MAG TPA: hypothetical protein ENG87_01715 [Candidatus Pacearchaeota archaeon]|nr:hypothetical protein [Candidatus Pacearchaeota archaeon]